MMAVVTADMIVSRVETAATTADGVRSTWLAMQHSVTTQTLSVIIHDRLAAARV